MSAFREKVKAESAQAVARGLAAGHMPTWLRAWKRKPEHYADIDEVQQSMSLLSEVNLQRWSPETRAKIRDARDRTFEAFSAMFVEAEDRFES